MNLVWLFAEHRELYQETLRLRQVIADLEKQLLFKPSETIVDTMRRYSEEVLAEQPFPDGKIPDNLWLTPESK